MKEIEVKILNIDRKQVEAKIIALGAKKVFDGEVNASLFDFPNKSIKDSGKTCRLRTVGENAFLTFKTPIPHDTVKIREEYEIQVSDFEETKKILESIGLAERLTMKKHRTSYALENVHFELDKHHDQFAHVPEYLEIEAIDIDTLYKYVELLGFKKEDCKPWTIRDIEKNINPKN